MIYILSDIHGNSRRFRSILKQIRLQPEDTLYVLGDVIDRYGDGIPILRQLMAMPNVRMLLGNHEYMMLRALGCPYDDNVDNGTALVHWYRNGGDVTHHRFKHQRKATQKQIIDYLRSLPLQYDVHLEGRDYRLVHATAAEDFATNEDPRYPNPVHFSLWKRWEAEEFPRHPYTVIFGHTPTRHFQEQSPMEIWRKEGYIGIDCGCGYPEGDPRGRLCCLRLDDEKVYYSEESDGEIP